MKPLSATERIQLEIATQRYAATLEDVMPYLTARGISHDTARDFRLGAVSDPISGHEHVHGRLAIPSLGYNGRVYALTFRAVNDEEPKYLGLHAERRLFNIRGIHSATDSICVTEGELDAITLGQLGYSAIGVSGANSWKRYHPRMLAGFARVYVFGDGDKAGRSFAQRVAETCRGGTIVRLPDGHDVNSLYQEQGAEAIRAIVEEIERDHT